MKGTVGRSSSASSLKPSEKQKAVGKLGVCMRCLKCHLQDYEWSDAYLCRNGDCTRGFNGNEPKKWGRPSTKRWRFKEGQEKAISKPNQLSPESAEGIRQDFTNMYKTTSNERTKAKITRVWFDLLGSNDQSSGKCEDSQTTYSDSYSHSIPRLNWWTRWTQVVLCIPLWLIKQFF